MIKSKIIKKIFSCNENYFFAEITAEIGRNGEQALELLAKKIY
ncbi:MAG: hypothetical protein ACFFG0_17255 [Candidatus Thorarchaeota archaeon]